MVRRARGERALRALRARYGETFPGFDARALAWVHFVESLWRSQEGPMEDRAFISEKLRLFREGHQWISSQNGRTWREPVPPRDEIRAVVNMIGPAQDYRLGVIEEQRPGFRVNPHGNTSEDRDAAEAQQVALEWAYHRRDVSEKLKLAMRFAQDWGVGCIMGVWNSELGQRRDAVVTRYEDGIERKVALDYDGRELPEGEPPARYSTGDVDYVILRGDQVRVDPEALSVRDARWVVVGRIRSIHELIFEYGDAAMKIRGEPYGQRVSQTRGYLLPATRQGEIVPDEDRFADTPVTSEFTACLAPSDALPEGLFITVAGGVLLHIGPLPFGPFIPIARFTDGRADPDFFVRPIALDWLDDQIAINRIVSRILQNVRMNSGGRLAAKAGSIVRATYTHVIGSVVEWKGTQAPQWLQAAEVGQDAWNALQFHIRQIENKSGWNDVARGQLTASLPESGRGILAIREQFERGMAPFIRAAARGMQEWAEITLKIMAWGYVRPRLIPIIGEDRPDLPRFIQAADLERETDVYVDPETMMPMPRALKLQMLREELQLGALDPQEYRRRAPYASIRSLQSPDDAHYARAKRINYQLEMLAGEIMSGGVMQPPILWQDNPGIHQQVLQDLILDDRKATEVRLVAKHRWDWYALLQMAHQGDPSATQQIQQIIQTLMPDPMPGGLPGGLPGMAGQGIGGAGVPGGTPLLPGGGGEGIPLGQNPYEAAAGNALGQESPVERFEQVAPQ